MQLIDVVLRVLGISVFVAAITALAWWLLRRSREAGVLRAVAWGLGIRLCVGVGTHVASVLAGSGGFFYSDDRRYALHADALAGAWAQGQLARPWDIEYGGSSSYGYSLLVGVVDLLTGDPVLAGKAVNLLLGGAVILLSARLAAQLFGEAAARRTAWLVALAPTLVWWSAPLLKEQLSACLLLSMLVAATGAWRRTGAWIVLAAAGLAVVRPPVLLAAIAGIAASRLPGLEMSPRQRARNAVIAVVVGAACVFVVWGGQPVATVTRLSDTVHDMTVAYRGGGPQMLPIDIVRSLIAPYPWVTQVDANWDLSLYPGNWVLICLYPTMLVGAWKLRGRTQLLAMLVIPILTLLAINSFASGTVSRQRSSIEPLLLILAVVGWTSSRAVLNRAAGALVMTALVAGVQSRSVLVAATVLLAAAVAGLAALRMTETAGEVSLTGSAAADAVAADEVHR